MPDRLKYSLMPDFRRIAYEVLGTDDLTYRVRADCGEHSEQDTDFASNSICKVHHVLRVYRNNGPEISGEFHEIYRLTQPKYAQHKSEE